MSLAFLLRSFADEDKPKLADKGSVSLTGVLQRHRLKLGKVKGPRKASLAFNPYAIAYGFCMREKVAQLCGWHDIWVKPPTPKEQLTFDVGHAFHYILQTYFWKTGMLEGEFECSRCQTRWWDRSPTECYMCKAPRSCVKYEEVPLKDKTYNINGRSDGILWLEVDKNVEQAHIMDIKSISNRGKSDSSQDPRRYLEDLDELGPLEYHVVQLNLYMMMSGIHDGHLLYVGKNGPHQMKSFHITHNRSLLSPYLSSIQQAIEWTKDLNEGTRDDLPPPCSSKKCSCDSIVRPKLNSIIQEGGDNNS